MLCFCLRNKTCLLHPYMYPVTSTSCIYKPINANALIKKSSSFYILKFDRQGNFLQQAGMQRNDICLPENVVKAINGAPNVRAPF